MDLDPVRDTNESQAYSRFEYEYRVLQKLVDLENENKEQNQKIEELMEKKLEIETEIDDIRNVSKETIVTLQNALEVSNNAVGYLTTRVENFTSLRSSTDGDPRPFYGFSAYESASSTAPKGSTIVLRHTRLNEGGAYNTETGHFTAPVDEIYILHATLCIKDRGKILYVAVMADEEVIGGVVTTDTVWNLCTSGSALARLQKGTKVFLRVNASSSGAVLRDDNVHINRFLGYLLGM